MRHWPLLLLRLTTPRLELRLPASFDDLDELADRALEGVHEPDDMPFAVPWTNAPAAELPRNLIQYHLLMLAQWRPEEWSCNFVVRYKGKAVGSQELRGSNFSVTKEVGSGSWLGRRWQGKGIGTEMRAAVLHFAFEGLGAETAVSGAFFGNEASLAVSRKLGYREDGLETHAVRGKRELDQRFRLWRADFESPVPVEIHGLEECREMFGAARA